MTTDKEVMEAAKYDVKTMFDGYGHIADIYFKLYIAPLCSKLKPNFDANILAAKLVKAGITKVDASKFIKKLQLYPPKAFTVPALSQWYSDVSLDTYIFGKKSFLNLAVKHHSTEGTMAHLIYDHDNFAFHTSTQLSPAGLLKMKAIYKSKGYRAAKQFYDKIIRNA